MNPSALVGVIGTPSLYLASAALVLWLIHRYVQPIGKRAAVALVLLPLCFAGRAMFTGRVYGAIDLPYGSEPLVRFAEQYGVELDLNPILHDVYTAIIPWHAAVRNAWRLGEWPLLNPFVLCGDPLLGSAQPAPFEPFGLLSLSLPLPWALTYLSAIRFFVAALGFFLLAASLGCRAEAAMLGAAGWTFCGVVSFWNAWPIGAATALLPFLLFAICRVVEQPGVRSAALLTAVTTAAVHAGHPETAAHLVLVGAVWGVVLLARRPLRAWSRVLGWTIAAGACTAGLCAVYLLPVFDTLSQTSQWILRGALKDHHTGAATASEVVSRLLPDVIPFVYGFKDINATNVPANFPPLAAAYVGSALLPFVFYGVFRGRHWGKWPALGLSAVGVAAGAHLALVLDAVARIPPFERVLNTRLVAAGACGLALLAALGAEAWSARGRRRGMVVSALVCTLALALLVVWRQPSMLEGGLPGEFVSEQTRLLLLPPVAVALLFLLYRRGRAATLTLALAIVLAQRVAEIGWFLPTLPGRIFFPRVGPLAFEVPAEPPTRTTAFQWGLVPNLATHYGLEDVRGYQAIHHLRFRHLFSLFAVDAPNEWYPRIDDLERPFLSFLNVGYALIPRGARPPRKSWRPVDRSSPMQVWKNSRALPRAFVPKSIRVGGGRQQVLDEMKATDDFSEVAWIEPLEAAETRRVHGSPSVPEVGIPVSRANGSGSVAVRRRGLGYLLDADIDSPAWVVISNVAWRGWRARTAGHELPAGIANWAFLAFQLPPGRSEVEVFFRPRSFEIGLAISATTLVLLVALVGIRRSRARRAGAGATAQVRSEGGPPAAAVSERRTGDRIEIPGDYQYHALDAGPAPQRFWHWAKLHEALLSLELRPGDRVLDAGCGSGLAAAMAAERPGVSVLGIDSNPRAIEFAQRMFSRPNLAFSLGRVDEISRPPAGFTQIIFLEVIEHLGREQAARTLQRFRALLAPGGRLVLSTPNRRSAWPLIEWLLDRLELVPNLGREQHEHLYSSKELGRIASLAGFELVELKMINAIAPWLALVSEPLARAVHRLEARFLGAGGNVMLLVFERREEPSEAAAS